MAKLTLNQDQKQNFKVLFELDDFEFDSLIKQLEENIPAGLIPPALYEYIDSNLQNNVVDTIIRLIISLHRLKDNIEISSEQIIKDILSSFHSESDTEQLAFYERRLLRALRIGGAFGATVKALFVVTKRERLLTNSEILTDIRPMFDNEELLGVSSIYTISLEYRQDEQNKLV